MELKLLCESIDVDENDVEHLWAIVRYSFNLYDSKDEFVSTVVQMVRQAYGADQSIEIDASLVRNTFSLDQVQKILYQSLPDPDALTEKLPVLRVYRSEACEVVAQLALKEAFAIVCPVSPHMGKTNPDQPVLGFDGWGFLETQNGEYTFVAIQVKGSDQDKSPPDVARDLAIECKDAPKKKSILLSAVRIMLRHLKSTPFCGTLVRMLYDLGEGKTPTIVVAPVIVRGITTPKTSDLQTVRDIRDQCIPSILRGVVVSLNVDLDEFGRIIMSRARDAA